MDYQLNVPAILRRGEQLFGDREIVTRLPDRSWHRYTYAEFAPRARRLAAALRNELGLKDGDRVGTFAWNHYQHLEVYIGVPVGGMVTHTLNLRLHADDLTYIATHAGDKVLIADKVLWPLVENFRERAGFEHVVAIGDGPTPDGAIEYEDLLASAEPGDLPDREIDERAAAAMCYTSGTTGQPKGALYSHRAIAVHSLASAMAGVLSVTEDDSVLPVVPMFHANAWGFPFTCTFVGAKQVFPGPFLDGESLLEAFQQEQVTITAGVPTIWMGILQELDANPGKYDTSSVRAMVVGGSAAPQSMIEAFEKRHGLRILHAWGMTEMCPLGTVSARSADARSRRLQGSERRARPSRRRSRPAAGGRAPPRHAARVGYRRAVWRRRVRGAAAGHRRRRARSSPPAKILQALEEPVVVDGRPLAVHGSIGIAAFPSTATTARTDAEGRHRDVSGQERSSGYADLLRRARPPRRTSPVADDRDAQRRGRQGVRARLSADRRAANRAAVAPSKRCCAGTIRSRAACCPRISSGSPSTPA